MYVGAESHFMIESSSVVNESKKYMIASFSGFFILDIPFIRRLLTKRSLIKSFLIASYVFMLYLS
jgi:hypothetical protein